MKPDPETAQRLRQMEELKRMTQSAGWLIAKGMLLDRVRVLGDVTTIPSDLSFEEMGKQAMFRSHVVSFVYDWLNEIESSLEQNEQQQNVLQEIHSEQIVKMYSTSA